MRSTRTPRSVLVVLIALACLAVPSANAALAKPNCAGDSVGIVKRLLDYGAKWRRGGRVCEPQALGLHCWN